ncbi:transposase family protein [Lysinibacillus sphaericus]|nr:hypothetical protein CTN02_20045 [Lysinibacillus sphaericus]QIC49689.1 transposase family protein [Lysinibacillus sphaericus]QPA61056.1 transposase family protein [Lysinibacillus sphaericus]
MHNDRGFQYTSKEFKRIVETANMAQSMSRVGRCIDNGPTESFWGTLKCETAFLFSITWWQYNKIVSILIGVVSKTLLFAQVDIKLDK